MVLSKVSLLHCSDYDPDMLDEKIRCSLDLIGFDARLFKGKKVAVKPNLLSPHGPETAVTTHPEFIKAVIKIIQNEGGSPFIIESPAIASAGKVLKTIGLESFLAEEKIPVAEMKPVMTLSNPQARRYKRIEVAAAIAEADMIVNLPKFKTHGQTYITGAVKNFFGLIPGLEKSRWHLKTGNLKELPEFMLDLYGTILNGFETPKPILNIMDAIVAMEGQGPGASGKPKHVGAIITSTDAIAVDYTACSITGIDINKVVTITSGVGRSLGKASKNEIELLGDDFDNFNTKIIPAQDNFNLKIQKIVSDLSISKKLLLNRPEADEVKCVRCMQCAEICPAEAIKLSGDKKNLVFDYSKCIRCLCCQEICPEAAIDIKEPFLHKILGRLFGR